MIKIKKNINLARLSTFRIGNKAKYFCEVQNDDELLGAIQAGKRLKIPYKIIAGGSNVVFPDKPLNCLLIKIGSNKLRINKNRIIADAGVPLSRVIAAANEYGLQGLETLAGIPGTLGGAIVGNAGAYGHSISEVVEKVEVWNGKSKQWLKNGDCKFSYRKSVFKQMPYIVLRVVLKFRKDGAGVLKKISGDIVKTRLKKYKPGLRCPGSFFKNILVKDVPRSSLKLIDWSKIIDPHTKRGLAPSVRNLNDPRYGVGVDGKIPAGYLLEQVGAKGMRVGGIYIADFHGNLLINDGTAKAADVKKIAKLLKNRVKKKFGINLEEEIRYF